MLTPQHSFGSISQRNRCVFARRCASARTTMRPTRRLRNLQDVARAFAHLDRGRGSCAARIQEWLSPRCRGSRLRAVEAPVVCSRPRRRTTSIRYGRHRTAHLETDDRSACVVPVGSGATMRIALHGCLRCRSFCSECGEVPNRPSTLACCDAEEAFSKPLRFEAADSQCSVLDRSSPAPPGSIASNRSTSAGGEGWIKRSQDSAISSQVRFSDALRVKCAIRSHSAAFARYSSFLFMGVFANGCLLHINRQTCRLFRLQRYDFGHRGVGRAELEKAGRAATGRGREQPSRARPRLLLYPTFPATMGRLRLLGLLRDTWHRPRNLRSAALEVRRLIDRFRSKPREFLGVLIVAVLARLQRHSKQSRGAVAQASSMVIPVGHWFNNDRFAEFVA